MFLQGDMVGPLTPPRLANDYRMCSTSLQYMFNNSLSFHCSQKAPLQQI